MSRAARHLPAETRRGFTLIEVLVALFILSGGILMIALSWSGNFMRIRKAALANNVATLLERKMIETEAKYKEKQLTEIPDEDAGDFGSDFPQYRWALKSRDLKLPDLSNLLIGSKEDGVDDSLLSMIKQVSEFLSKSIKEVKISVFFKRRGGKDLEFSAVQYFVDYSQDLGLGGVPGQQQTGTPGGTAPGGAPGAGTGAGGAGPAPTGGP